MKALFIIFLTSLLMSGCSTFEARSKDVFFHTFLNLDERVELNRRGYGSSPSTDDYPTFEEYTKSRDTILSPASQKKREDKIKQLDFEKEVKELELENSLSD